MSPSAVLYLGTWYKIAFPSRICDVMVTVDEDSGVPPDHFVMEIEASPDLAVEMCRLEGMPPHTLSLCTNGMGCLEGGPFSVYVERTEWYNRVMSMAIPCPNLDQWFPPDPSGSLQLTLYFTLIPPGVPINSCNPNQPDEANALGDLGLGTVGAFPMVFAYPGENNGGKGNKIRVIWR
jgi:hypothetical protein